MPEYRVLFKPDDREVTVPDGQTLLEAAQAAGVHVNSLCGGDGVCGKCKVIVLQGEVGGDTDLLSREEIQKGYVLACQTTVKSDMVVDVPEESRMPADAQPTTPGVEHIADLSAFTSFQAPAAGAEPSAPAEDMPLVRKYYLELTPPSMDDSRADHERLVEAIEQIHPGQYQTGLKVVRRLPELLRKSDWKVTATVAFRGGLLEIVDVERADRSRHNLGVAIDVGTTTVVAQLMDLDSRKPLTTAGRYNSQIPYGSDVIRRIIWGSSPQNLRVLQEAVTKDVDRLIRELADRHGVSTNDITCVVASGNTTMLHLLGGLDPQNIRREPFAGVIYVPPPFRAAEVGIQISPRGLLYSVPAISGFVGGDITSGILATGLYRKDETAILIDVGTNGEIVIGNSDFMVCTSASAGPAFEGSETTCGTRCTDGAITKARIPDKAVAPEYTCVGDVPANGICGTGYVDLLAEMLLRGVVDRTGKLQADGSGGRVRMNEEEEELEYVVARAGENGVGRDIVITQTDIQNLVRAKGAIYAATRVMLKSLGIDLGDVGELIVGGAFGTYLNTRNAVTIGMLPDMPADRVNFVGNSSLAGARLCILSRAAYLTAGQIARSVTYMEMTQARDFMDQFVSACFLPHTEVGLFPSVEKQLESASAREPGS